MDFMVNGLLGEMQQRMNILVNMRQKQNKNEDEK